MPDDERTTSETETATPPEVGDEAASLRAAATSVSGRTIVLWALCSIALLAYVALGSVPTYIWRFGRLYEETKPVLGIWTIEVNNLPQVSHQWILNSTFYAALIVFLFGAVVGLWFLLGATENEITRGDAVRDSDSTAT
jgi:hypothetical protein